MAQMTDAEERADERWRKDAALAELVQIEESRK